jgi:protein involved in polysaccharide export with SLBB domain
VGEELLEAQAVEEPIEASEAAEIEAEAPRPLPEKARPAEVDVWRGEVRTVAIAAAGGLVAGAATVAVVRAVRGPERASRKGVIRRGRKSQNVVASRSFLVDVHVLGR